MMVASPNQLGRDSHHPWVQPVRRRHQQERFVYWIAIKVTKRSGGDPLILLALYGVMTVVFSAVLNNVTAIRVQFAPSTQIRHFHAVQDSQKHFIW